jgi:hypothetical protein
VENLTERGRSRVRIFSVFYYFTCKLIYYKNDIVSERSLSEHQGKIRKVEEE